MTAKIVPLAPYSDDKGNSIDSNLSLEKSRITFKGSGNRLILHESARIANIIVNFDGNNALVQIGANRNVGPSSWNIRAGEDSKVVIGNDVSTTSMCVISAVEGTSVVIGNDVMFATGNQLRADDGHAIYDVVTGNRVNDSKSISIGDHVWIAYEACLLGGAHVGGGSVIGFRSVLNRHVPNNCIAAGIPARVIRENIAWERPHLSLTSPPYRPDSSHITPTLQYWKTTEKHLSAPAIKKRSRLIFNKIKGLINFDRKKS
ncbi:acyltransferase [Jonesia quinghaiensis]|uniref:acyltransferase n=1 Tax=Jonesia quinghaiensis TaxID=262806 RepID=UPI0009FF5062|nr:acyltransferase [Jonesia quinghaiensis]